ncbi:MAG: hypothetical protein A2W52_04460 [Candidatus Taylorbacteria bacterium RIFCSPHIGHO2_02_49_25]|uniref:M23ase beta-sheet core domain-containing protein n=1 Tax=Candidatus Taylorbacteria bacterium RIFCSPHIGHO2_02_49_25 TaxID=1802305 RepID=A0A1G2MCV3_9BACT|nr:MAG: Peptidase M23 [Parcubacteria group bacterium GW2011_GWF2_50_9]OHA21365.1 MAG: hypothetical protein A2759_00400 [Candidatus Taylorbacteria bacterium RIFCSPHIGHO2_01_FULL_49_60]OHA21698.1 MAG: hypothetical protein A2W52_04460 [Candidatus Taylorbacteria bacterium RIFCSPHIGHO2_02_49_25]OHA35685.1 MAG: hypothetical protein A2W65_01280 [Candidatus Taylorbacteria bacterium RIFCSPLOWO2_02_50_13]OHA36442.1 MAG: hypothetical protein A3B27_02610 [Candidatus Taylorbacteria bacterium RIFCSPLOWO2_01_
MWALLFILSAAISFPAAACAVSFRVAPKRVMQGDPLMVVVADADIPDIKSLTFFGKSVGLFLFQGKPTALIGIDLVHRMGAYTLAAQFRNGDKLQKTITIVPREKISTPLGIPEKLGGNTKVAQKNLVALLWQDNTALSRVRTTLPPWWGSSFALPLKNTAVVDPYGYSRSTGSYSIAHKGTDFRAATGTPVFAINNGFVRLAREFVIYGKTVAIDHGGRVVSFSMHLSEIKVKEGERIARGQLIGLSGESGYALGPHLHLSIRVGGVSIDPMAFFALF